MAKILETDRLILREMTAEDAPFILELVNDPDWLTHIGDKGVRTLDDARAYIENGPVAMYREHGFGLFTTVRRSDGVPIGICGLLQRESLPDVDLGFALLPAHRGHGYAFEAARATLDWGYGSLGLDRIVAIATRDNQRSIALLEKLGLGFERTHDADGEELVVFA